MICKQQFSIEDFMQKQEKSQLNHLSQKTRLTLKDLNGKMTLIKYQAIIDSLFKSYGSFIFHFLTISQYCIALELQPITFFFARAYLDALIKNRFQLFILNEKLACIGCVWIAIKFNQKEKISSCFTSYVMVSHGDNTFDQSQLINMERDICQLLKFKLGYTIPLHYAQTFFESFPTFTPMKEILYLLNDFTISIVDLGWQSSEDIFHAIFITCIRIKKIKMNHSQILLFKQKVSNMQKIIYISEVIYKTYILASEQKDQLLNQPENDILLMLR